MGKVVGAVIGAITIVVGVVTGNVWLIAQGASMVAGALLTPKIRQNRQASAVTLQLGEVPREAAFGELLTGGSLVDAFNYGGKYGTDWECVIIALADHECNSLTGFYVNDKFVSYTGDGVVAGYNNQLEIYWRSGTEAQTVPSVVTTNGPGWTANDNGAGVAWVAVCYKADKGDAKDPIWPAGRPRFSFLVKGKKCYQARKDSTVAGGSGAHRWADPATWEWTDSPIDCRYNWVRGVYACNRVTDPSMLLVGRGLSSAEAPPENVAAPANVCDELVSLDAGGSEKRYRANGLIQADDPYISVEELFASACAGVIIQPEGSVEIEPGQAKSATFFFSDEDLLVGSSVRFSEFLSEGDDDWVNTIIPRYVEPTQKYADHAAPLRRVIQDVIDDGGSREQTLQLPLVTSGTQAGRVGEIARRMGRLWKRGQLTLGPRFAEVEEGDWGVWTSQRYLGGASVTFRVEAYSLDEKWHNTLNLRQISSTVFAQDADKASSAVADLQGDPPPIGQPGAGAFSLAAIQLNTADASIPALAISGAVDDDYPNLVLFEYWKDDGVTAPEAVTTWTSAGYAGRDVSYREITSVAPGATYYAAVSYVVGGEPGERRILGPVTVGYPGIIYADGTLIEVLKPAEPGATAGATLGENLNDGGGVPIDPVELLNSAISLSAAGVLSYNGQPLGTIHLPDLGAASDASRRRLESALDDLAGAVGLLTSEASSTRATFRDAGFFVDPATGIVKISAIEQTAESVSEAFIRLAAAEANILLRATTSYVDNAIATAVIDPSQIAELDDIYVRLGAAEINIDGLQASILLKADITTLSAVEGRVTTAEADIDALAGIISLKADTTTVDAIDVRVTGAEESIEALGDVAAIRESVTATRWAQRDAEEGVIGGLWGLLQGDYANRLQVIAIADARRELTSKIVEDVSAEAAARLALGVRVGAAEAGLVSEQLVRASADSALSNQITSLTATVNANLATVNASITAEQTARADGDNALAASITTLEAEIDTEVTNRQAAVSSEASARVDGDNALAASISSVSTTVDGHTASITEHASSIDGLEARWGVKLDVNGKIIGIVLNNDGDEGDMDIVVDRLRLWDPDGLVDKAPFEFRDGGLYVSQLSVDSLSVKGGSLSEVIITTPPSLLRAADGVLVGMVELPALPAGTTAVRVTMTGDFKIEETAAEHVWVRLREVSAEQAAAFKADPGAVSGGYPTLPGSAATPMNSDKLDYIFNVWDNASVSWIDTAPQGGQLYIITMDALSSVDVRWRFVQISAEIIKRTTIS